MTSSELFRKYDVPAPRYTSYPTVPYWSDIPPLEAWLEHLREKFKAAQPWAMYLHIPFCETLCTFCGCNTTISRNHKLEHPYTERLHKELDAYLKAVPDIGRQPLAQLHLGGGTPTFLSEENLALVLSGLKKRLNLAEDFEASIEVDPRRTRLTQLEVLREFGFRRISLGVQDFDKEVQRLIHREQTFEQTQAITEGARKLGYDSVNFDLIYGLPKQNLTTIDFMIKKTLLLRPDRIALYSFAKVPWIKPSQRLFKDEDLPEGEEKRKLYEAAREQLLAAGYLEIGMDHFALPTDALAHAAKDGTLHRNFMGYTEQNSEVLLGLGVSAISETSQMFFQNEKILPKYESAIDQHGFAPLRGHRLSTEDQWVRRQILDLMTRGETSLQNDPEAAVISQRLQEMVSDGLLTIEGSQVRLLPAGKPFLRNVCLAFDRRFFAAQPTTRIFSQAI